MRTILTIPRGVVLYVADVDDGMPVGTNCTIEAWRPPGIDEISEVFHARIVDYGYPSHTHDTWTVLIVDTGAIAYDLDRRSCGAVGTTVAILPPGVVHNGKPATHAAAFTKRVLYLDETTLPLELIGAAVDRTNIEDLPLRSALAGLHDELVVGVDPFTASSALALITERITNHLLPKPAQTATTEPSIATQLRLLLDEAGSEHLTLDMAAARLDRSKPHLIRSFTAQFGIAPHAYLIGRRVEVARKLLLDGRRPADVAAAVGFYDQSHFTKHFKRHTAMPPAAYATSHGQRLN